MKHFVEIRSCNLKPGIRDQLDRRFINKALPMLKHWDVAAFGPSPHAEDSYYLIRRHDSLIHREQSQDACHGSDEGKQRLGEPILALIENYTSIVLEMDEMTLHSLRK